MNYTASGGITISGSAICAISSSSAYNYIVSRNVIYTGTLSGSAVLPPNTSGNSGTVYIELNPITNDLTLNISHTIPNPTTYKLFRGIPGELGTEVLDITSFIIIFGLNFTIDLDLFGGSVVTKAFINTLSSGGYLQIASSEYPTGELRADAVNSNDPYFGLTASVVRFRYWSYTGSGTIITGGDADERSNYYAFTASGGITIDSTSTYSFHILGLTANLSASGTGGILIGGIASLSNFKASGSGGITMGGTLIFANYDFDYFASTEVLLEIASMTGSQMIPPNNSPETASVVGSWDGNTLNLIITHSIIPALVNSFTIFGPSDEDENGTILLAFSVPDATSPISVSLSFTDVAFNQYYMIINTFLFPSGDVRGQFNVTGGRISVELPGIVGQVRRTPISYIVCPDFLGITYEMSGGITMGGESISAPCTLVPVGDFGFRTIRVNHQVSPAMNYITLNIFTDPNATGSFDCDNWNNKSFILFYDSTFSGLIFKRQGRLDGINITLKTQPIPYNTTLNCWHYLIDYIEIDDGDFILNFTVDDSTGTVLDHPIIISTSCENICWRFTVYGNAGFAVFPYSVNMNLAITLTGLTSSGDCVLANTTYGPGDSRTNEEIVDDYILEAIFSSPTGPSFPNKKIDTFFDRIFDTELEDLSTSGAINSLGVISGVYQPTGVPPWVITYASLSQFGVYEVNNRRVYDPVPVLNTANAVFTSNCVLSGPTLALTEYP